MSDRATTALALSTVALVPSVFSAALPPLAAVHASKDEGGHLAAAQVSAILLAGSLVVSVAVATRTPMVAGLGLLATGMYAYAYSHARLVGQP